MASVSCLCFLCEPGHMTRSRGPHGIPLMILNSPKFTMAIDAGALT